MSLSEVERLIKTAVEERSPRNDATALQALEVLVAQRPADIVPFESSLRDIYDSNPSMASLDLFIEILYVAREHLTHDSIGRVWWDLVLRPALRREHMSKTCIEHAISVTMSGLDDGDSLFRAHLVQNYLRGVPSLNSVDEAVDNVFMSTEERAQDARWKYTLVDLLSEDAIQHPAAFFEELNKEFLGAESRPSVTVLLSKLAAQDNFPIVEFGNSPLMMAFLRSMAIDNSGAMFSVQLTILTMLLPLFVVRAPESLRGYVSELLVTLARAICWQVREGEDPADINMRHVDVIEDLQWQRLEYSFEGTETTPADSIRYFTFLYGIYPCNVISFLRRPAAYLNDKGCRCPFQEGWAEALDEDEIRTRCDFLLRHHVIHPALVKQTEEDELTSIGSWRQDIADLVRTFSLLEVRNVAGASQDSQNDGSNPSIDAWAEAGEILGQEDGASTPMLEHAPSSSRLKRGVVSIRQLMETHMMLRSGMPVDIANDFSDIPSTPRTHPTQVPAYDTAAGDLFATLDGGTPSGSRSPVISLTSTQRMEAKDEAISTLQRDLLLLMNELNFETYLRRHYLAQIGTLHRQNVQTRSSERERQRMRDQIKKTEQEIERYKREKRDMQNQLDRYREGGDNYSSSMRGQIHKLRQEKAAWLAEAQELRNKDAENKDVLQAQKERLEATETQIFELQNEKKESAVKIQLIKDYEKQIELLRKAETVWHADHLNMKRQSDIIDQTKSKLFSMQQIISSEQNANAHLVARNQYLEEQYEYLTDEVEQLKTALKATQNPDQNKFAIGRQKHLEARLNKSETENERLRAQMAQLSEQLMQEKIKRETLERQRHGDRSASGKAEES